MGFRSTKIPRKTNQCCHSVELHHFRYFTASDSEPHCTNCTLDETFLEIDGAKTILNLCFSISLSRAAVSFTMRVSPDRPISPKTTVPSGTDFSCKLDMIAMETAKSIAGSVILNPPATLTYIS